MSAEAFLFATLSVDAGVTALVGAGADVRIFPDEAKEGVELPLIVFDQGSTSYERSLDDTVQAWRTTISVTCWAKTRLAAETLADAVVVAMGLVHEPVTASDSDFDQENQAYAAVVTFDLW